MRVEGSKNLEQDDLSVMTAIHAPQKMSLSLRVSILFISGKMKCVSNQANANKVGPSELAFCRLSLNIQTSILRD